MAREAWRGWLIAGLLTAAVAACSGDAVPDVPEGPADAQAELRPDLLTVEPQQVTPGSTVDLLFPEATMRGLYFVLERAVDESWQWEYDMVSAPNGAGEPRTVPALTEGFAVPDEGVFGPGPDHVLIPEDAQPGSYRICTGNASDEFCAEVEVVSE